MGLGAGKPRGEAVSLSLPQRFPALLPTTAGNCGQVSSSGGGGSVPWVFHVLASPRNSVKVLQGTRSAHQRGPTGLGLETFNIFYSGRYYV